MMASAADVADVADVANASNAGTTGPVTQGRLRVALSTPGTFHSFDLARQLQQAGVLAGIHTAYPRFKLDAAALPAAAVHTFPWLHGPYMAGWVPARLRRQWEHWDHVCFDAYVAATLPECDVFCGLSGAALRTGRTAQRRGARYVCDRGSAHIRFQDTLLREEHARWGIRFPGIDPRVVAREEQEYAQADAILVPSRFAYRSFVEQGVAPAKLRLAPYGVDLRRFAPVDAPRSGAFDMLFVGALGVRKGAAYLFAAYEQLRHARKTLTIAGRVEPSIVPALQRFAGANPGVQLVGHVPQAELKTRMSRAHVLVLPSVEDGFGLVQAQAMACACPVVASRHTGAEDLFDDGVEGYIVAPRDAQALGAALQALADEPALRDRMAAAALRRVARLGGWEAYGQTVLQAFTQLAQAGPTAPAAAVPAT
jgi:glycosyltransferase involved in cell wall biosynthesis